MADNISIRDATGAQYTMRTTDSSGIHTPHQVLTATDQNDNHLKVKTVTQKFRDDFAVSPPTNNWVVTTGNGGVQVVDNKLILTSSLALGDVTSVKSINTYSIPFKVAVGLGVSPRQVNQTFYMDIVAVDNYGSPTELNRASWVFDGTTVTQAKYEARGQGGSPVISAASTVVTTAGNTPTSYFEIEPSTDGVWFFNGTIDSTASRTNSYRRQSVAPDPNQKYALRFRFVNSSVSSPAVPGIGTVSYVAIQESNEIQTTITGSRGSIAGGQSIPIYVTNAASVIPTPSATVGAASLISLYPTAGTGVIKNTAGVLNNLVLTNAASAPRYFKLYNSTTAPTLGTSPAFVVSVPANDSKEIDCGAYGMRFTTGIAFAVTEGIAPLNASPALYGEVLVNANYT